jgi:hypothetical protein
MPRPENLGKTIPVNLTVPEAMHAELRWLANRSRYGVSVAGVAATLLAMQLRQLQQAKELPIDARDRPRD